MDEDELVMCDTETGDVLRERHAIIFYLKGKGIDPLIIQSLQAGRHWALGPPYNTGGYFDDEAFYKMLQELKDKK